MKKILILLGVLFLFVAASCSGEDTGGGSGNGKDGFTITSSAPGAGLRPALSSGVTYAFAFEDTNRVLATPGIKFTAKSDLPGELKIAIDNMGLDTNIIVAKDSSLTLATSSFVVKAASAGNHELALEVSYIDGEDIEVKTVQLDYTLVVKEPVVVTPSVSIIGKIARTRVDITLGEDLEFANGVVRFTVNPVDMVNTLNISDAPVAGNTVALLIFQGSNADLTVPITNGVLTLYLQGTTDGDYSFDITGDVKKKGESTSAETITAVLDLVAQ